MPRDPEIASINASIADAKRDADNAFAAIRPLRQRRDAIKAEIGSVKARIDSLKSERAREYEAIGICRAAHNRIDADNHRYRAQSFSDAISREYDLLNSMRTELDVLRSQLDREYQRLEDAKARKARLYERKNARYEQLNARRAV